MPKKIDNLKEIILEQAKKQLFTRGYSELTMRNVAEACNIAVGTLYNYYQSKDVLVAQILLEDWHVVMHQATKESKKVDNIEDCMLILYNTLQVYIDKYTHIWVEYGGTRISVKHDMPFQYNMLINQLSEIISEVMIRCYNDHDDLIPVVLSEMVLNVTSNKDMEFEQMKRVIKRMF